MKALILGADRTLDLVERPRPACSAPDDVVLRVVQVGICGTDRGVLLGKFPAVPGVVMGHEAVGEVVETGAGVTTVKPGDRVIVNPTLYCGLCDRCRDGVLNFCRNKAGNEIGIDRDGAFAEFMLLEEQFLHLVPDDMPWDRAVLVEPLACVLNNLQAAALTAGDRVAVLGAGPIGAVTALAAAHFGASVRVVEKDPFRLDAAASLLGGTVEFDCAPRTADVVVDTVGSLLPLALEKAADLGRIVVMGFDERASATVRPLELLQRGLRIIGAGDYNSQVFGRAVRLARELPLERIVSHHFGLDRIESALRAIGIGAAENSGGAAAYAGMKVVVTPGGGA